LLHALQIENSAMNMEYNLQCEGKQKVKKANAVLTQICKQKSGRVIDIK